MTPAKSLDKIYADVADGLARLLADNKNLVCVLLALNLPLFVHVFMTVEYRPLAVTDAVIFALVAAELLAEIFVATLVLKRLPKVFTRVFVLLAAIFFLLDAATLTLYKSLFDKGMFQVLLDTNPQEAAEYLRDNFTVNVAKIFYVVPLAAIVGLCFKGAKFFVDFLLARNLRVVRCVMIFGLVTLLAVPPLLIDMPVPKGALSVVRMAILIPRAVNEIREYREIYANLDAAKIEITRNESDLPFVIFILGEATNRNHMGIYGYDKPTTPNLQRRLDAGDLIVFTDCVSGATETMPSCQRMFTFFRNEIKGDGRPWYTYTNLFDILKAAGYHTAWLSNQEITGIYGNVPRAYADRCDEKKFTTPHDTETTVYEFDEKILPLLDESLSKNSSAKNFYVLHLLGTHLNYRARYPDEFDVFRPEDETSKDPLQREYRAAYDNAVLYNDFIVEQIIERFADKDALIVYVADHGENVFEDGEHLGHSPNPDKWQLEIPALVWLSDECKAKRPELLKKISAAKNRPFMTDDLIHALLDLLKIHTPEFDSRKSLFSDDFDATRKRIYKGREYRDGQLITIGE